MKCYRAVSALVLFCFSVPVFAAPPSPVSRLPSEIYYDADSVVVEKNQQTLHLEGHATLLIGNVYVSAQQISLDAERQFVTAIGEVNAILSRQKATASRLMIDLTNEQVRLDHAEIFSDPTSTDDWMSQTALHLSKAEMAFDLAKIQRLEDVRLQLKTERDHYNQLKNLKRLNPNNASIDQKIEIAKTHYAQLLKRDLRTQYQSSPYLLSLPHDTQQRYADRRRFVEEFHQTNPSSAEQILNFHAAKGYVFVKASHVTQLNTNVFVLNEAVITSCHCSESFQTPIFGLEAQQARMEIDEFLTMKGAALDVFGMPIVYIPWIEIPVKTKRESGFLIPSAYSTNHAGTVTSEPYYFVLGDSADTTTTYQYFSSRGSRVQQELRWTLSPNSQLYLQGDAIHDATYQSDWQTNEAKIQSATASTSDSETQSEYQSFSGANTTTRYSLEGSVNLPYSDNLTVKFNEALVSDNNYLADFSPVASATPQTTIYGNMTSASRRFLPEEAAIEYYGDNLVASVREQGAQDLFADSRGNTPTRLPRFEVDLLPQKYISGVPVIWSAHSSAEYVNRLGAAPFIEPTWTNASQKTETDPYGQGERIASQGTATLPLPFNSYLNASLSTSFHDIQYNFKAVSPYPAEQPSESWASYKAHIDIPMYADLDVQTTNRSTQDPSSVTTHMTQTLTPFVDLTYIPAVARSQNYPQTYSLWYAADSHYIESVVTPGVTLAFSIQKEHLQEQQQYVQRLPINEDPVVANTETLKNLLLSQGMIQQNKEFSLITLDSSQWFALTSEESNAPIFWDWAQQELENYDKIVREDEHNKSFVWPQNTNYSRVVDFDVTPISLTVSSGYNFLAKQTAYQQNADAGSVSPQFPVEPYQDVKTSLNWNGNPWIGLNGTVAVAYSQYYHRIDNTSTSSTLSLWGNRVVTGYTYAIQYQAELSSTNNDLYFIPLTQQVVSLQYNPISWVTLGFQWAQSTDPASTSDTSDGRAYATSYNVSLFKLQDCMDVVFARNKPAGVPENQAIYAISLNMSLLGYNEKINQVGAYVNNKIQNEF